MSKSQFFNVLFDLGDHTCFAASAKGTYVFPVWSNGADNRVKGYWEMQGDPQFFSINPLHPTKDLCPTESWHKPDRPRRANGNVVKFRNILIEFDNMQLDEQIQYVNFLGLPFSTCVYSGGKSYHFIISLETPLKTVEEYSALVERIYKVMPIVDKACKNPSRLSRFPGALRNGRAQELISVKSRIKNQDLEKWLIKNGEKNKDFNIDTASEVGSDELWLQHGTRWEALRRFAGRLRAWGLNAAAIKQSLLSIYENHCEHIAKDMEIDADMDRLSKWAARRPPGNTKTAVKVSTIKMVMPDGRVFKVPLNKVDEFQRQGGRKL